jgi:hypothetical protein
MLVVEAWLIWRSKADWGFERRYESDNLIAAWATPHFSPLASHLRPARQHMRFRGQPHPTFLHSWRWEAVRRALQEFTIRDTQLVKLPMPWRYPGRRAQ